MSLVKQIALISAGCQPWNLNVVDATGSRFAYAATLAIYIYQWNSDSSQFYLHSIMSEHKKTITAIAWHPKDTDILASSSTDFKICVWHVTKHKLLAALKTPYVAPGLMAWYPTQEDCIVYCDGKGPLYLWQYHDKECNSFPMKDLSSPSSNITQMNWHNCFPGRFALGHSDGTLSFYLQGKKPIKHVKIGPESEDGSSITCLLWDPFSSNYLLVCTASGRLQLIDCSGEVITTYSAPSKAVTIKCVAWLQEVPGGFVSGDAESGVLRIWTVSKDKPQENFKLKQVGFKAICVLPLENSEIPTTSKGCNERMKFVSRIVCLFFDGGVGVYNLRNYSWDFLRNMGHLETIFDCQFKPDNCDLLATASFDGTVKVWDVNTMEAITSSPGDASIIYSLSWAPNDSDYIAAATSKSGIFIWNIKKGSMRKIEDHEKGCYVYCVAWNQKDARKIASASGDGTCMVHQVDGKLLQTFKHPAPVYGCDWNPNNENIVATACEDGLVRVFYDGSGTTQPLKTLSGHEGKVFRVKWAPLKDGILCSTSDDCTVRVWHYAQGTAIRVLKGHTNYTRGLLWCPELPSIIISGSWDSTIRVWDISDGACLDVIEDHGADVYGLACHCQRPFVLASTSRDSTVRIWSVLPLVSSIYMRILVCRPQSEIFSPSAIQNSGEFEEAFGLYGSCSRNVKDCISKENGPHTLEALRAISSLFCCPSGVSNLWDLVCILKEKEVNFSRYKNGIVHRKHVIKLATAKAVEKEFTEVPCFGSAGVNSSSKDESLRAAADYYLLSGNLKKYCELKVLLGEWFEAIAISPGVSVCYWKELCSRWMTALLDENSKLVAPFAVATNQIDVLIKYFVKQNFLEKAHLVSVAAAEGLMACSPSVNDGCNSITDSIMKNDNYEDLINENIKVISERYMLFGSPVQAACGQLTNGNIKEALYCLLRGNELELTVSLCISLGLQCSSLKMAVIYLSWRCIKDANWDLAMDVLDLCAEAYVQKIHLCINCNLSVTERNALHEKAGLPPVEQCASYANEESGKNGSILKIVQYYLLSNEPKKGLEIGLNFMKDTLAQPNWTLDSVWEIVHTMSVVSSHLLQDIAFDRHRFELQFYSAYIGAVVAIRQGFYPVVIPLFSTALDLIRMVHNPNLPITEELIISEMQAWISSQSSEKTVKDDMQTIFEELHAKAFKSEPFGDIGVTTVSGSHLPRHSDHHRCFLREISIQGPVYFLEDYKSAISLNDALMWAKVNRFSPLKTGMTINPF